MSHVIIMLYSPEMNSVSVWSYLKRPCPHELKSNIILWLCNLFVPRCLKFCQSSDQLIAARWEVRSKMWYHSPPAWTFLLEDFVLSPPGIEWDWRVTLRQPASTCCFVSRSGRHFSLLSGSMASSGTPGGNKLTVREIKKRSKKSRTLPIRLKLLGRKDRESENGKLNLSVFKGADGEPWSLDIDRDYEIYMDAKTKTPVAVPIRSFSGDHLNNLKTPKQRSEASFRSKSLSRVDGRQLQALLNQSHELNSCGDSVRSRSRSRSRLGTMNASIASFSQCFGFKGKSKGRDLSESDEDYSEFYYGSGSGSWSGSGSEFGSREWSKVVRRLPFGNEGEEGVYASGYYQFYFSNFLRQNAFWMFWNFINLNVSGM